jgi:hypothetical protein
MCGGLDSVWLVWELHEESNDCRVSVQALKGLMLAVCRYANACGYCIGWGGGGGSR